MNTRQILPALHANCSGRIELRALPSKARLFTNLGDVEARGAFIQQHAKENLYFGVATRRSDANGTAQNCLHLGALFADLDFKASTEATLRTRLAACRLPPSLVIATGGGLHVYWLLVEPLLVPDAGPWLRRLATWLDADLLSAEPARVLRIPGCRNFKYDPPRLVTVEVFDPARRYALADFDGWLPTLARPSSPPLGAAADRIPAGDRNGALYRRARSLRKQGLAPAAVAEAIRAENREKCDPPLDDAELDALIRHALAQADRPEASESPAADLELVSMADLLAMPVTRVEWLVEDRIPVASVCLLAGKPKAGKTTLARQLALDVARGGTWLGHQCHPGVVWYLALEGRPADHQAHFRALGACDADPVQVFIGRGGAALMTRLRQRAAHDHPDLIIVDTMQRLLRAKSTDDYAEMTTALDDVIALARESGAAVLLLHHAGKADRASIDAVLGSTAITGSVDNVLVLVRSDRYRLLSSVQRVGPDLDETVVLLDEATQRVRLGASRDEADRLAVADELWTALANSDDMLPTAEWLELVEGRRQVKLAAVRTLLHTQRVHRLGTGTRNDPYRYAVLVSDSGSAVPYRTGNRKHTSSSADDCPKDSAPVSSSHSSHGSRGSQRPPERPYDDVRL